MAKRAGDIVKPAGKPATRSGSDLFIVDNSDSEWKVIDCLELRAARKLTTRMFSTLKPEGIISLIAARHLRENRYFAEYRFPVIDPHTKFPLLAVDLQQRHPKSTNDQGCCRP